jgi:flagella basal body P-ring formation protein FlgA
MTPRLIHAPVLALVLSAFALRASADPAAAIAVPPGVRAADTASPAVPFTSDQLVAALTRDLADHFRLSGDFQLELVRPWIPPDRTAAAWDVVVTEYPEIPSPTLYLRCRVLADGEPAADVTLSVRAMLWRDAWFAREPMAAGSTFDPSTLDKRRVDSLRERDSLPTTVGDDSFILARQVPADRMLTWQDVARRPLVRKGDIVDVVASEGGLLVTMKAQAVENGVRGDIVTVRNIETRKDISGQVVDEDRVEVRF